ADGIWESRSRPGAWKYARKTRGVEERAVRQHPDRHGDRDEEGCECEGTLQHRASASLLQELRDEAAVHHDQRAGRSVVREARFRRPGSFGFRVFVCSELVSKGMGQGDHLILPRWRGSYAG